MFYDTHAHLDYPDFSGEIEAIVERAQSAGITRIISIGTDLESSRKAIALADRFQNVFAVVGWHPNDAAKAPDDLRSRLKELVQHPKVVAIGETGLDYFRLPPSQSETAASKKQQERIFLEQLEIAAEFGLNCVIHQRDLSGSNQCFVDLLRLLEPYRARVRTQFHCFAGTPTDMQQVLGMNGLVSFTGILTFKNGQNIRDTLAAVPLGKFMLETDCPFLAPVPYRGKRCEPAYVKEIAEVAAQVKQCTLQELSAATCAAAHEFFPKLQ
ncbi:MAG TPA: TatD family hydrolase [Verrucomicrobiae bacterium]|jgi:TatD DNase family protein